MIFIYNNFTKKKFKEIIKLKKSKYRKLYKKFLLEGSENISKIFLQKNYNIEELLIYNTKILHNIYFLKNKNHKIKVFIINKIFFKKISYNKFKNKKIIAIINYSNLLLEHKPKIKTNKLIIILNNIEKPGNIGAVIRSAAAGDVSYVILNNIKTDLFNPNIIQSSIGSVFNINILINNNTDELINWLLNNNITIISTSISKNSQNIYNTNFTSKKIAIILGSENKGVSIKWLKICKYQINIPMKLNFINSLNISVAAAIIIFEYYRQNNLKFFYKNNKKKHNTTLY